MVRLTMMLDQHDKTSDYAYAREKNNENTYHYAKGTDGNNYDKTPDYVYDKKGEDKQYDSNGKGQDDKTHNNEYAKETRYLF